MQGVSIVICTFQRWEILLEVLEVLIPKISNNFELLIINNDLNAVAPSEILTLVRQHSNIKYLVEEAKGLSHARNRGVREAKNDWLLFLDDDAKINEDIFEKAIYRGIALVNRDGLRTVMAAINLRNLDFINWR